MADSKPDLTPIQAELNPTRRIFTNRNLRMESIQAVGFDMDHTVAVYNTPQFNRLCFDLAIERLVDAFDYPAAITQVTWDPDAAIRGLVVDKRLGNLLKIDAFNHVTRARHGMRFLEKDELRAHYPSGGLRLGTPRYRVFDTLFDLPEGCIFAGMMDLQARGVVTLKRDNRAVYDNIREAVDTLHADGSLKARIMADLGRYFLPDPDLVPTLERFRAAGKKLFLLTNSEVEYTAAVMDFLVDGAPGAWEDLFDVVVCTARKPKFFLKGTDGVPVPAGENPRLPNRGGKAFVGGDSFFLEKILGAKGDQILYFGDHTYGDILRSKKSVGWRTALIVPEIEDEITALRPLQSKWRELTGLEERLEDLVMYRDRLEALPGGKKEELAFLKSLISDGLAHRARLQTALKGAYNPHWESHFREGRAASRFGRQTLEFACIYTSRVSNFLNYPADKFFARPLEVLPHERWALSEV